MIRKLIVYACPVGPLGDQLNHFFVESEQRCGRNEAHRYMPHCTLTGFFYDDVSSIPVYVSALAASRERLQPTQPTPVARVVEMILNGSFHHLRLVSPWLQELSLDFVHTVSSPTRVGALKPKSDLHVSLAYRFAPEKEGELARLAREIVDPRASVGWELRFYEQHSDDSWTCHAAWTL